MARVEGGTGASLRLATAPQSAPVLGRSPADHRGDVPWEAMPAAHERRADPPGRPARTHRRARHRVVPASGVWEQLGPNNPVEQAPATRHRRAARRYCPGWRASAERPSILARAEGRNHVGAYIIHPWQGEGPGRPAPRIIFIPCNWPWLRAGAFLAARHFVRVMPGSER